MKLVDFAQTALIALTNRLLHGEGAEDLAWFEATAGFSLSRERSDRVTLRFYAPEEDAILYPEWLKSRRAQGARRLRLLQLADFHRELERPEGGAEINDRQLAGFANTHETVLGLELPDRVVGLRLGMWHPPPTDLTRENVLRFMEESPEHDYFRAALLWQDEHNLHFTDGKNWDAFLAAVTPEGEEDFVSAFSTSVSNVAVSEATAARWRELRRAHETRRPGELRAVEFASVASLPFTVPDFGVARAALDRALSDCAAFAAARALASWGKVFADALAALRDAPPSPSELDAVFARLYSPDAARLLSAASRADVFGAMGSWNDLGLDSDPDYIRVSEELFVALAAALPAACSAASA